MSIANPAMKTWCEEDHHYKYEYFADFNEWIDSPEGAELKKNYNLIGIASPSKAFYAGDPEAYEQEFKAYQQVRKDQVLSQQYINEQFTDDHWYERNTERFNQLIDCLTTGLVVPFVGAGLSVEGGFPSWKQHLQQQGRTSGLDAAHVDALLNSGQYEQVIEEIEAKNYRDAFIQELRDVFSKTGKLTGTTLRLAEIFTDTIITTNYDSLIEQVFDTGAADSIQLIGVTNINEKVESGKTTIVKLHGDIRTPASCILGKNQYDDAYGETELDLSKPIPKFLSYYYKTSSLLFLGCSLNHDRTMQVFKAVKDEMGDKDRPQHFSLESMPENEEELSKRNAYLLSFGITPIWFPYHCYEYIEQILVLARNELRYRGYL